MFNDDDTFTPTARDLADLREFLTLDDGLNPARRVAEGRRTRKVRSAGTRHRDEMRAPSAAVMFHRLDVCDLIG